MRILPTLLATALMAPILVTTAAVPVPAAPLAAKYQTPTTLAFNRTETTSVQCGNSSFREIGGGEDGGMLVRDCEHILRNFEGEGYFTVLASGWKTKNVFPYWVEGTCMFGFGRHTNSNSNSNSNNNGSNDIILIGDGDIKRFLAHSVHMRLPGSLDFMESVQGQVACNTVGGGRADIEWTLRVTPNATRIHLEQSV
ncbi:hypothetical protein M406DRAFT_329669 [Cryphonectria parasitica EP155]|uniref:Ecp2 effector protein-like domain-containing protein n=1 Tax=Cryphonectria parasitica (strain ATCC 38755 / EP155) TaxID=660469 RepID=A0A9P4Y352_CRYP1|nr:uncharacterized protein M406DRAFT_329669 [Cryphonectria parasitica EP155]KAF3765808.1 hypothetical protein M406DRAFT_329669 [Cryphonectria parasitica EP155]